MASGGFRRFWISGEAGWHNNTGRDYLFYSVELYPTDNVNRPFSLLAGPESEPQVHQLGKHRLVFQSQWVNRASNHKHFFRGLLKSGEHLYNHSNVHCYVSLVEP